MLLEKRLDVEKVLQQLLVLDVLDLRYSVAHEFKNVPARALLHAVVQSPRAIEVLLYLGRLLHHLSEI